MKFTYLKIFIIIILYLITFINSKEIIINNDLNNGGSNSANDFNICNQEIIAKDWGFQYLKSSYENDQHKINNNETIVYSQNWIMIYPQNFINVYFVQELQEPFFTTDIVGYNAIKLEKRNDTIIGGEQNIFSLQQTLDIAYNESFQLSFRVSTTLSNFKISIKMNTSIVQTIPPSQNTFDRSVFTSLPFGMSPGPNILTIHVIFDPSNQDVPIIYLENIVIMRLPNEGSRLTEAFVSNSGSDIYGDGTTNSPFSSVQQALYFLENLYPSISSLVYIYPGVYCGMGNSYIDTMDLNNVLIVSLNPNEKAALSGEFQLAQVSLTSFTYDNQDNNITFESLVFMRSSNRPGGYSVNIDGSCTVYFIHCDFEQHYGDMVLSLNYLQYAEFFNCTFTSNTPYAIQSVGVFSIYTLKVIQCTFNSINSISLLNLDKVVVSDTKFLYSNSEDTGTNKCPIVFDMITDLSFQSSQVETALCVYRSYSFKAGNLTFGNQPSNIYIQSAILVLNSNAYLGDLLFQKGISQSCVSVFKGSLAMGNTLFNETGSDVSIQVEDVFVNIYNVSFFGENLGFLCSGSFGTLSQTEVIKTNSTLSITKSEITLKNSTFFGNDRSNMIVESTFITENCLFVECNITIFTITTSNYTDNWSTFEENMDGFIVSEGATFIQLNGTFAKRHTTNPLIILNEQGNAVMTSVEFSRNELSWYGLIKMYQNSKLNISNSVFNRNTAITGTVVYLSGQSEVYFSNVTAHGNYAEENGGVICSDSSLGSITIDGGVFTDNSADSGSFIYYYGNGPVVSPSTYYINQTIVLGQIFMDLVHNIPPSLQTGSDNYEINITFVNNKHHTIDGDYKFDKTKKLFIAMGSQLLFSVDFPKQLMKMTIGPFTLSGPINSKQTLYISSDAPSVTSTKIQFSFLPCLPGYYPGEQNTACEPCPYSTVGTDGLTCQLCPPNAQCFGADKIAGLDGYWIDYNSSLTQVYQCPEGVCFLNVTSSNTTCAENSQGILCAGCIDGYYNCGSGCKQQSSINKLVLSLKIVMFIILVVAQQWSNDNSGLVTIALYFLQTLVVISNGIKFSILNLFSGAGSAHAGKSDGILSFLNDCIGPYGFYWNHYFIILQPAFLLLILSVIILFEYLLRKSGIIFKIPGIKDLAEKTNKEFRNRQFSAFVKVCMNSYGPFATELLLIFFCNQVGDTMLLNANPEVQCYGSDYYRARLVTLCLFSVLFTFPFVLFILLFRHRNKLDDVNVERKLGVFYLKYIRKFYFWDVALLLKRISIVTVSLLPFESKFRSISLVTLGLFYLFVHLRFQPFVTDQDNNLETVSLVLLFTSCIYLDNGLYEETEQYIVILCIAIFIIAAFKTQSKYLVGEFNRSVYPILIAIWEKISKNNSTSNNGENVDDNQSETDEYRVIYNGYEDYDIDQDQQYAYDSFRNIVKEVDKKGTFYKFGDKKDLLDQQKIKYTYGDDDDDDDDNDNVHYSDDFDDDGNVFEIKKRI